MVSLGLSHQDTVHKLVVLSNSLKSYVNTDKKGENYCDHIYGGLFVPSVNMDKTGSSDKSLWKTGLLALCILSIKLALRCLIGNKLILLKNCTRRKS